MHKKRNGYCPTLIRKYECRAFFISVGLMKIVVKSIKYWRYYNENII